MANSSALNTEVSVVAFLFDSQAMKKVVLRKIKQNILNNNSRTLG